MAKRSCRLRQTSRGITLKVFSQDFPASVPILVPFLNAWSPALRMNSDLPVEWIVEAAPATGLTARTMGLAALAASFIAWKPWRMELSLPMMMRRALEDSGSVALFQRRDGRKGSG